MRELLKFKKLLNEFRALEYEFEYNKDVLKEAGEVFESSYLEWCDRNGVNIKELQTKKRQSSNKILNEASQPECESRTEPKLKQSKHREIFKSIAKKLHPDRLKKEDPRKDQFVSDFRKANSAMNDGEWGELFDVVDKYDIEIDNYDEANISLEKDIERMTEKLKAQHSTYAWHLQNCGTDPVCHEMVIRAYLQQVYGWDGNEGA